MFTISRLPTVFNPGPGAPTRFGFFGKPVVPIMYGANRRSGHRETLLHDIPVERDLVPYDNYSQKALARLQVTATCVLPPCTASGYDTSR